MSITMDQLKICNLLDLILLKGRLKQSLCQFFFIIWWKQITCISQKSVSDYQQRSTKGIQFLNFLFSGHTEKVEIIRGINQWYVRKTTLTLVLYDLAVGYTVPIREMLGLILWPNVPQLILTISRVTSGNFLVPSGSRCHVHKHEHSYTFKFWESKPLGRMSLVYLWSPLYWLLCATFSMSASFFVTRAFRSVLGYRFISFQQWIPK